MGYLDKGCEYLTHIHLTVSLELSDRVHPPFYCINADTLKNFPNMDQHLIVYQSILPSLPPLLTKLFQNLTKKIMYVEISLCHRVYILFLSKKYLKN